MTRTVRRPAVSFEQWAAGKGIKLAPDHILAEVIGGALIPSKTRAQRGKWRSKLSQLAAHQEAQARYNRAVATGEIPTLEEQIPLDMTKSSDQAYARVLLKRAARAAAK